MQVLEDLISGTRPSHRLHLSLQLELFGVLFDMHHLIFQGQHARRLLFLQQTTNSHIIIRRHHEQTHLVCVVSVDHFRFKTVFRIIQANVYVDIPQT